MPWHHFEIGDRYQIEEVVATLKQRIRNGGVQNVPEKKDRVEVIASCGFEELVWKPKTQHGFGVSPFNPNNWTTTDGMRIWEEHVIPKKR